MAASPRDAVRTQKDTGGSPGSEEHVQDITPQQRKRSGLAGLLTCSCFAAPQEGPGEQPTPLLSPCATTAVVQ